MATVYTFIDPVYVKQNSCINLDINIEEPKISNLINMCQRTKIWPILGTVLYEKILSDCENNTLAGAYLTLVTSYIIPTLNAFVQPDLASILFVKINNQGANRTSGENQQNASLEEIQFVMAPLIDAAEFEKQRLIDYLQTNQSSFSEYSQILNSDDMGYSTSNYDMFGIYTGDGVKRNSCEGCY